MKKKSTSNEQRFNQRGIALAVTLMILLILVIIAMSIGAIGVFNLKHVNNYKESETAYYAAKAGVVQAIDAMRADRSWTTGFSDTSLSSVNAAYTVSFSSSTYYSTNNLSGTSAVTRGDGIYVPAGHAYIVGTGTCNGKVRRVASMVYGGVTSSNPPWQYALFGYDSLGVGGTADITGDVGTNASSLTVGGSSTVSGDQDVNAGQSQPAVTDPTGGGGTTNITSTCTLAPGAYGSISLSGGGSSGKTVTLSAGNYSFTTIDLQSKGKIEISSGPVYIYVSGDLKLTGQSVTNTSHNAANCLFYGTSTCTSVTFRGGSDSYFGIYAPSATASFAGTSDMHGSAIGKYADATGTAQIIYDNNLESLSGSSGNTYLDVITWQNVY